MTARFRPLAWRLAIAGFISLLIHAAVLWLPNITLPRHEAPLPLLSAKLIPLQKRPPGAARAVPKPQRTPPTPAASGGATFAPAQPLTPQSAVAAASAVSAEPEQAASAPAAASPLAASGVPAGTAAASAVSPAEDYAATSDHAPPLPKHARLRYLAQLGAHGMYIGEVRHELTIADGRYTLHAELETTGLASLIKRYQNVQESRGSASPSGLRPDAFTEAIADEHGTRRSASNFDWGAHQVGFASGEKAKLPDGAQDILSFLYQLSQLPYNRETIPLAISNGRKLDYYQLETGAEELIDTPMGKLRALHLTKIHKPGEEGLEVWLATEYRLLPVKLRQIERDGKVAGEIVIKEIRVSDE